MKKISLLILLFFSLGVMNAQRYMTEVFTDVNVTQDQVYGINATVLALSIYGEAVPQPLAMDVYSPADDTETNRPLIIMMHTGNFLPPEVNGGCTGTYKDNTVQVLATRLAKMGYVVASADYRQGWNPVDPDQTTRVYTLINAAYRGVQDSRTCIRYFRKTVAEAGNPWGIDDSKIILWGVGTGGYISYASATLDTITDTYLPKFITPAGPMVFEPINGNVDGTTVGIAPEGYPGFPAGDTLCYPNHVGYSSEFNMGVNLGGALGDSTWIDAGDVPFISYHVPTDPFAPCADGIVNVPPPINLPVVDVVGSCTAQPIINALGLNDCMVAANFDDPISQEAAALNGGLEGFYPFLSDDPTEGSPWAFQASLEPYGIAGSNCDTMASQSLPYLDTIVMYFAPRAFTCLDLGTGTENLIEKDDIGLKFAPNPATASIRFETNAGHPVQDVQVFDLNGRLMRTVSKVNSNNFTLDREQLNAGIYIIKLRLEDGISSAKVVFY